MSKILRQGQISAARKLVSYTLNSCSECLSVQYFTARLLRYLAVHHVYREIQPDVFVNNRNSSLFDTGKSVSEILAEYAAYYIFGAEPEYP